MYLPTGWRHASELLVDATFPTAFITTVHMLIVHLIAQNTACNLDSYTLAVGGQGDLGVDMTPLHAAVLDGDGTKLAALLAADDGKSAVQEHKISALLAARTDTGATAAHLAGPCWLPLYS